MENNQDEELNNDASFSSEQLESADSDGVDIEEAPSQDESLDPKTQPLAMAEMSSVQELFQKSWEIFKFNLWKFVGLMFLSLAGVIVFVIDITFFRVPNISFGLSGGIPLLMSVVFGILAVMSLILMISLGLVSQASMLVLVRDSNKNLSFTELLQEGMGYAIDLFWVKFLTGIIVTIGFIFFVIPGIVLAGFYSMVVWALFYEEKKGYAALSRSMELVKGYWWPVSLRFSAVLGGYYLIMIIPYFIGSGILSSLLFLSGLAIAPFFVVYSCFIYWDLIRVKGNKAG